MATRTRAVMKSGNHKTTTAVSDACVEDLIRLIVAATARVAASPHDETGSEQIILDTDLDGDRYLLVRMPKTPAHVPLSPRELEIVRMVAQGHPNKIIADVLGISSWTVCTHIRRIFAKLGVGSRAAMVARLLQCGAPPDQTALRNGHTFHRDFRATATALPAQVRVASEPDNLAALFRRHARS